jgi:endogenous inhibitor of DNA gyrase (YacG/DUF329 family)
MIKCPTCNKEHTHEAASMTAILKHKVSHGATMLFIQANCPMCTEDQVVGPPNVTLA